MTEQQSNTGNRIDAVYRHHKAYRAPRKGFEAALVSMIEGIDQYADAHLQAHGTNVADDGVIGASLAGALFAVRGLLDGELGRLDGGELWGKLDAVAKRAGWRDLDEVAEDAK